MLFGVCDSSVPQDEDLSCQDIVSVIQDQVLTKDDGILVNWQGNEIMLHSRDDSLSCSPNETSLILASNRDLVPRCAHSIVPKSLTETISREASLGNAMVTERCCGKVHGSLHLWNNMNGIVLVF